MCGILAFYSKNQSIINIDQFKQALNILTHRGPDGHGTWFREDKRVGLGHRRLSIIDLEHGHQPLTSADSKILAVVNGEFYEFEKIRADLIQKGYIFKTESDSEILIALYQEYGTNCLEHLRGEFAFVLWDEAKQQLFAARDRFGIKPLFYTYFNETWFFASEIKALLNLGIPAEWDVQTIISWQNVLPLQDRSIFKNIQPVKPGHFLIANNSNTRSYCYWDFNYPKENEFANCDELDIIHQFRQELTEAIKIRLRADVPVGCYLSGGLDSSAVLGIMSHLQKKPVDSFTISFEEDFYDEASYAKEMADRVNANLHVFKVSNQLLAENFEDTIYHAESVIFNNNMVAKFLLSGFTRQKNYKVILTGEGSDENLGGYLPFRMDISKYGYHHKLAGNQHLDEAIKAALETATNALFPTEDEIELAEIVAKLKYKPANMEMGAAAGLKTAEMLNSEFQPLFMATQAHKNFVDSLNEKQLVERCILSKSAYLWSKSVLPGSILTGLGDRSEMAHSLEARLPFLDHQLVEFLVKVPSQLKINGVTEKYLLREACKDLLPKRLYERIKHPFMAPPAMVKPSSNPLRDLMEEVFNSPLLKDSPFYCQKKVLETYQKVQGLDIKEQKKYDLPFMLILSTCILGKIFALN